MGIKTMIFSLLLVTALLCVCNATILDQYVHAPDPTYKYRVVNKFVPPLFDITVYNIELTSCSWLTPKDTSTHIWKHWLQISIPHNLRRTDTGFLYIDGGSNPVNASHPPVVFDSETKFVGPFVSEATGVVTSVLMQIPNEPARFPDDNPPNKRRTEDAIIAYTWRRVVNGSSPEWFLRLPMTKAVVKAMDTIEHFTQNVVKNVTPVKKFIVAGASKRGWTTWTTMAVDTRVVAAVPIVMPGLDLRPTFNNAYRELGGWSFALKDYIDEGLMGFLNLPEWKKIEDVVDPYTYLKRYTMPKMLVAATGDEFFPLDSERHWWSDLPGPKALSLVANAEHSLASGIIDVASAIGAFVYLIVEDKGLPEYSWEVTRSNGTSVSGHLAKTVVNVAAAARPFLKSVQSWKANTLSSTQRDFRLIKCRDIGQGGCFNPVFWWPTTLSPVAPGRYEATSDAPSYGWSAFLIELIFEYPDPITQRNHTLTVTTQSNIVPDMVPFGPCGFECACGTKCPPKP